MMHDVSMAGPVQKMTYNTYMLQQLGGLCGVELGKLECASMALVVTDMEPEDSIHKYREKGETVNNDGCDM